MPIFPQYYLHKIYQGVDYQVDLTVRDADGNAVDLTGADLSGAIASLDNTGVAEFLITILDASLGRVRIEYPSSYPVVPPGRYLHQLLATLPSEGIRAYYAGDVQIFRNIAIDGVPIVDANAVQLVGYEIDFTDLADNYILKFDSATEKWFCEPDNGGSIYTFTAPLSETAGVVAIAPASGSAAGSMSGSDFAKLSGIATGATANATDAQLRDRTTHTGSQAISTVTGLQAALDDKQARDTDLDAIANITTTGFVERTGAGTATARSLIAADIPNLPASTITSGTINDAQIPSSIARDSEVTAAIAAITPASIGAAATTDTRFLNATSINGYPIQSGEPTNGYILKYNSATDSWDFAADGGGGGGGIALTDLSATTPLTYNNITGAFGIQAASGSQAGALSSTDWTTFNNKQSALAFTLPLLNTSGTVTINAATTSAAGSMSSTDKTKLDGIATGATANSADATLLARANHTGTQTASTISDFNSSVDARLTGLPTASFTTIAVSGQSNVVADSASDTLTLVAGSNITLTTNATTDTLTIAASGGGSLPSGTTGQILRHNGTTFAASSFLTSSDDTNAYFAGNVQAALNITALPAGSSEASPRVFGFSGLSSGNAVRFELGDQYSGFRLGFNKRLQLTSYHGLEFWGSRGTTSDFPWTSFTTSDANLSLINTRDVVVFDIFGTSGQTTNFLQAQKAGGSVTFSVSSEGVVTASNLIVGGTTATALGRSLLGVTDQAAGRAAIAAQQAIPGYSNPSGNNIVFNGNLKSNRYQMGSDLRIEPTADQQTFVMSYWAMQLGGCHFEDAAANTSSYLPIGSKNDWVVVVAGADPDTPRYGNENASCTTLGVVARSWQTGGFFQRWFTQDSSRVLTERASLDRDGIAYFEGVKTKSRPITNLTETLITTDAGKTIKCNNASAQQITIPPGMPDDWSPRFIQVGAGRVEFLQGSGVNIYNRLGHTKTAGQYAKVSLDWVATNTYILSGDTGA